MVSIAPQQKPDPFFVSFRVPLSFNKLDLRDYLRHIYGVHAELVRSWVVMRALRRKNQDRDFGRFYRPMSLKFMSVKLQEPFVLPKKPRRLDAWDVDLREAAQKLQFDKAKVQRAMAYVGDKRIGRKGLKWKGNLLTDLDLPIIVGKRKLRRQTLVKRAQEFTGGKKGWENGIALDRKWDDVLKEREKQDEELKKRKTILRKAVTSGMADKGMMTAERRAST